MTLQYMFTKTNYTRGQDEFDAFMLYYDTKTGEINHSCISIISGSYPYIVFINDEEKESLRDEFKRFYYKFKMITASTASCLKLAYSDEFDIYLQVTKSDVWNIVICSNSHILENSRNSIFIYSRDIGLNYRYHYGFRVLNKWLVYWLVKDLDLLRYILNMVSDGFGTELIRS